MSADHDHGQPAAAATPEPAVPAPEFSADSTVRRIMGQVGRIVAMPLIWLIRAYQLVISPLTPPTCRYYPSCSAYALTAIQRFGPIKGTWLAGRRLLRCHPWTPGGVDHVPERPHTGRSQPPPPAAAPQSERPTTTTPKGLS